MSIRSWPRLRRCVTTSHSMRHSGFTSREPTPSLGVRLRCVRTRTRLFFIDSERDPVTSAVQVVHGLHREEHGEFVARLLLRNGETELELAAARDHVLEHAIDGVLVDSRPPGYDATSRLPDPLDELRGGDVRRELGSVGEEAAEVPIVELGMV